MSIRHRGFVAAMEDDGTAVAEVEVSIVPAEVEQASAEVTEAADDVVDETEAMEDVLEDIGTLQDISDVATQSVDEAEGLDPLAAQVAEIAVEAIYARLGITKKATPSMEAFGSSNTRKSATRIAVEDWKDTIKQAWDAVVKFFKGIYEKIKAFFVKFFDGNAKLKAAAEAMKKKVVDVKDVAPEKAEVDGSAARAFSGGGAAVNYDRIKKVLNEHIEMTAGMQSVLPLLGKAVSITLQPEINAELVKLDTAKDMIDGFALKVTPGAKAYFDSTIDFVKTPFKEGVKGAILKKNEMSEVCDEVIKLCNITAEFKKVQADVEKMTKAVAAVSAAQASILFKDDKEASEEDRKKATEVRKQAVMAGSVVNKIATKVPSLNYSAGKSALNYVADSMKLYKEPKAAE